MITFDTIGFIKSPYQEKFGIPRQPNLVPSGKGELHLISPYNNLESVRGLEQFSHLWLLFIFNKTIDKGWKNMVRPPRLGGNNKVGVFASRSTFRPNPIGLSSVKLEEIVMNKNQVILKLGSIDIADQTPIIDIKPYIPYSDSHPNAIAGYAETRPEQILTVEFTTQANQQLLPYPELKNLISEVISQDPRPAYKQRKQDSQEFGITLCHKNIRFKVENDLATILYII